MITMLRLTLCLTAAFLITDNLVKADNQPHQRPDQPLVAEQAHNVSPNTAAEPDHTAAPGFTATRPESGPDRSQHGDSNKPHDSDKPYNSGKSRNSDEFRKLGESHSSDDFHNSNEFCNFDESRYLDIDQVHTGMHGYGLTVFHGTQIERFEVEVVSVMRNFRPKRDAILIRCLDERFEQARGVSGVSGSPVYFDDKLAGAMAFGWSFSEEPLYGVTPIRQMLAVQRDHRSQHNSSTSPKTDRLCFDRHAYADLMAQPLLKPSDITLLLRRSGLARTDSMVRPVDQSALLPLPLPMVLGGFDDTFLEQLQLQLGPLALRRGLAGTAVMAETAETVPKLQPGATITIPLITGDMSGFVLGTVTEIVGESVYGFGHAWNGRGSANWPMGTGYIHTFVSRTDLSFKLGQALGIVGAIRSDETAGIYGQIGYPVESIPVRVKVNWLKTGETDTFETRIAQDKRMDPLLATMVGVNAVLYRGGLPRDHTINYAVEMFFDQTEPIRFKNVSTAQGVNDIISDVLMPLAMVLNNPWQPVKLTSLNMQTTVTGNDTLCFVKSVQIPHRVFRPGDTVKARVILEPRRASVLSRVLHLSLPQDIEPGDYKIAVGDFQTHYRQLRSAQPHRYQAFDADDVARILQERLSISRRHLYLSAILPARGLAIEGHAMPDLPASRAMMLNDQSRKLISHNFRRLISTDVETDYLVVGGETFNIQIIDK